MVDEPSISWCRRGFASIANIFALGAFITIRADLIFGFPVFSISDLILPASIAA